MVSADTICHQICIILSISEGVFLSSKNFVHPSEGPSNTFSKWEYSEPWEKTASNWFDLSKCYKIFTNAVNDESDIFLVEIVCVVWYSDRDFFYYEVSSVEWSLYFWCTFLHSFYWRFCWFTISIKCSIILLQHYCVSLIR